MSPCPRSLPSRRLPPLRPQPPSNSSVSTTNQHHLKLIPIKSRLHSPHFHKLTHRRPVIMHMIPLTPHPRIPPRRLPLSLPPFQFPAQPSQKVLIPAIRMTLNKRISLLPQKQIQHQFPQLPNLLSNIITKHRSRIIWRRYGIRSIGATSKFVNDAVFETRYLQSLLSIYINPQRQFAIANFSQL